jgi:prepilin-type N-terminal cleavage/methylation domain-containing protein
VLSHVTRARRPDDAGFTLVELLVGITVLGLIVGALTLAFTALAGANRGSIARTSVTFQLQRAALTFADDAEGAKAVTAVASAPTCGSDARAVVEFQGTTFDPAALASSGISSVVVTYALRTPPTSALPELHRLTCSGGSATPSDDRVVATALRSAQLTACGAAAATTGNCANASSFTLTVVAAGTDALYTADQSVALTGTRRIS